MMMQDQAQYARHAQGKQATHGVLAPTGQCGSPSACTAEASFSSFLFLSTPRTRLCALLSRWLSTRLRLSSRTVERLRRLGISFNDKGVGAFCLFTQDACGLALANRLRRSGNDHIAWQRSGLAVLYGTVMYSVCTVHQATGASLGAWTTLLRRRNIACVPLARVAPLLEAALTSMVKRGLVRGKPRQQQKQLLRSVTRSPTLHPQMTRHPYDTAHMSGQVQWPPLCTMNAL